MPNLETHSLSLSLQFADENITSSCQWVQLFGLGKQTARDGREWWLSHPNQVIQLSLEKAGNTDLVVDYEHQTDKADANGKAAPAAGWIKKLELRETGIWAFVEWTKAASEMIRNREYRYISPTFQTDINTGEIIRVLRAALTNNPALELTALAKAENGDDPMSKPNINEMLGLEPTATTEQMLMASIKKIYELQEQLTAFENSTKTETTTEVQNFMIEMAKENQKMKDAELENKINSCIKSGVFPPSMKAWGLNLARKNEKEFDSFVASVGKPFAHLFESAIPKSTITQYAKSNSPLDVDNSTKNSLAKQLGIDPSNLD